MHLSGTHQHGSSHVSAYDEKYTKLGSWVKRQRAEYKKYQEKGRAESQMTKERIDKLGTCPKRYNDICLFFLTLMLSNAASR